MNLTAWNILGIEATTDARAIRRAYATRLRSARPEDDPAAFQLLTDAYEWANATARQTPSPVAESGNASEVPPPATTPSAAAAPDVPLGRPLESEEDPHPSPPPATEEGFAFAPFFETLAAEVRKRDPKHLRQWLDAHPDLYSLELKWALTPHVFDTLAHNATELDPHRGHLDTLMAFFGVDARLRRHPALAPALDYLELGKWREKTAVPRKTAPMPKGWENLSSVMDDGQSKPLPARRSPQQTPGILQVIGGYWWLLFCLFAVARLVKQLIEQ